MYASIIKKVMYVLIFYIFVQQQIIYNQVVALARTILIKTPT